jgi:hypothetical protein
MAAYGNQLDFKLAHRSPYHARSRVGHAPRLADVQDRGHSRRARSLYCHGHGVESVGRRGWRILCHSRRRKLGASNCTLLTLCCLICQRHWKHRARCSSRLRCGGNIRSHRKLQRHLNYFVLLTISQYLGIPLLAGIITRFAVIRLTSREFFDRTFVPRFSPLALAGLLYTIIVMFAYQGHHIVQNLGPVFRVFVPMILYFVVMWTSAFALVFYLARREFCNGNTNKNFPYEMAVVQAFTAGSNNFVRSSDFVWAMAY